jgi:hypothetical protein
MIVMVYTMVYIYGIYHDIYHLPLWYIPWYIPKVVYTTFGVVYTMRQPSRWRPGPEPGLKSPPADPTVFVLQLFWSCHGTASEPE